MKFEERKKWADALLACSVIRERRQRDAIIDELRTEMRTRIQRDETDHMDIMNILRRVVEFDDGMTEFIQIIEYYEGNSQPMQAVQLLYQQTYITTSTPENNPTIWANDETLQTLQYPVLDRREPVALFQQLLDTNTPHRFMRLLGAAKMGKSHLLTKVFPDLARQQNAHPIIMDMRRQQAATDCLYHIFTQLGVTNCPTFDNAYQEWINRPPLPAEELQALLSSIGGQAWQEPPTKRLIPHLTRTLVEDLHRFNEYPIVLLCDAVDEAAPNVQEWLMNLLLVQLHSLPHVHVVVGGRKLPEAEVNYATICQDYELGQVEDHKAYIDYCQALQIELAENVIYEFAKVFDYAPGRFVETIRTYYLGGHSYA